jgi:hypothetical protein
MRKVFIFISLLFFFFFCFTQEDSTTFKVISKLPSISPV